jgi:hypothetical protein
MQERSDFIAVMNHNAALVTTHPYQRENFRKALRLTLPSPTPESIRADIVPFFGLGA